MGTEDDAHFAAAVRAEQRKCLVDSSNQAGPLGAGGGLAGRRDAGRGGREPTAGSSTRRCGNSNDGRGDDFGERSRLAPLRGSGLVTPVHGRQRDRPGQVEAQMMAPLAVAHGADGAPIPRHSQTTTPNTATRRYTPFPSSAAHRIRAAHLCRATATAVTPTHRRILSDSPCPGNRGASTRLLISGCVITAWWNALIPISSQR